MKLLPNSTKSLQFNFILLIVLIAVIDWVKVQWNLVLMDTAIAPQTARDIFTSLSREQKRMHSWFTATFDVVLPLLLGMFLAGVTLKSYQNAGRVLVYVPFCAVGFDLLEGLIQLLILTQSYELFELKAGITSMKFLCYALSFIFAIFAGIRWLAGRIKSH